MPEIINICGREIKLMTVQDMINLPEPDPKLLVYKTIFEDKYGNIHAPSNYAYNADEFIKYILSKYRDTEIKKFNEIYIQHHNAGGYCEEQLSVSKYNRLLSGQDKKKKKNRSLSISKRFDVLQRDGYRCCLCGRSSSDGVALEVDHKIPVANGGKNVMSNLWTLCFDCNRGKRDKEL